MPNYIYIYTYIWSILGDPPIYENTQNLSYLISKDQPQFLAGIGHGHGLHNCHLAGDCFDTIGHLKEWEKMGNNPGRGEKKRQRGLRIDKGYRSYLEEAATLAICLATCSYH